MKVSGKKDLQKLQKDGMASLFPERIRIMVGMATCCLAKGSAEVMTALKDEIKKQGLKAEVVPVGCIAPLLPGAHYRGCPAGKAEGHVW